jgi:hypothetical protein
MPLIGHPLYAEKRRNKLMSVKSVKDFFDQVEENKTLQEKLKALDKKARDALDGVFSEVVGIGKAAGFIFTAQDFIDAKSEQPAAQLAASKAKPATSKGPVTEPGCLLLAGCGYNHPMWSLEEPTPPCGSGQAYVPPGYGRG